MAPWLAEIKAALGLGANLLGVTLLLCRKQWKFALGYALAVGLVQRKLAAGPTNKYWHSLEGKTAIITGCNTGIGYETALAMAKQGCQIICACRSEARARAAMEKVKKTVPGAKLLFVELDLSSVKKVNAFCDSIERMFKEDQLTSLDYLVNNAGGYWPGDSVPRTADGFDIHIGANHLGPVLLTERLLPYVVRSDGRITLVSSTAFQWAATTQWKTDQLPVYQDLLRVHNKEKKFIPEYGLSKVCNLYHGRWLAKRLAAEGHGNVLVTSVHPGGVMTEVFRNASAFLLFVLAVLGPITSKYPAEGAQTTLYTVFAPKLHSGGFYADCTLHDEVVPKQATEEDIDAVMDWSLKAVGLSGTQSTGKV